MKFANILRTLVATCVFALTAHAGAAPILLVDSNGILTGVQNVDVLGTSYNVSFTDGSCNSLLNGCDRSLMLGKDAFASAWTAVSKAYQPAFANEPSKFRGCTNSVKCEFIVPFANPAYDQLYDYYAVSIAIYMVYSDPNMGGAGGGGMLESEDTKAADDRTFAIFSLTSAAPTNIPEPSSIALLGVALGGLMLGRRRSKRA